MRWILLFSVLSQSINDDTFPLPPAPPAPSPFIPDGGVERPALFTLDLDDAAVSSTMLAMSQEAAPPVVLTIYSRSVGCPPCAQMRAELGDGDDAIQLQWVYDQAPAWVRAVPTIYNPATNRYLTGKHSMDTLRAWCGVQNTVSAQPPVLAGSATLSPDLLAILESTQGTLTGTLPGFSVPSKGFEAVVPNGTKFELKADASLKRMTFNPKPHIKYGVLKISASAVAYNVAAKTVTVELDGVPDFRIKIK